MGDAITGRVRPLETLTMSSQLYWQTGWLTITRPLLPASSTWFWVCGRGNRRV